MFLRNMLPRKRRVVLGALAAVAAVAVLAGCASSTGKSSGSGSKNYKIAFVPKSLGNNYFKASDSGGSTAVKKFGGSYQEVAPATASPTGQVSFVQTLTQQRVGGIVLAADDPQAACTALNAAMKAGVKVVTFDSDTNCRSLFVNQVTPKGIAKSLVNLTGKALNGKGTVAIESGGPNATNLNLWIKYIKSYMASLYPGITIVTTVYGNDDAQQSLDAATGLLQKYPSLNGIIAPDTVAVAAAARYLSTSQYKGKVYLTGLGLPSEMRSYIKDGTVTQFALWDPSNLGYLAAYADKALIDGTITGKKGDTFTAGKLGKYTVGAHQTVILGPPTVFDKSNIDNYNF
ncbi:MAG TPA: rhamnose ABC transporter substrate-binding protein [Galbitalea sp.]|jgi:rhamnose transport system substrate-binding protein|nr:rhamnose ABC transporter substrate-binding protein [Galbitalea sp.]